MSTLAVLLKESWGYVEDRADDLANNFYARIFLEDPSLRELFPVAMTEQRTRWVQSLVSIIQMVDDPDSLEGYLSALGRAHRRFHVEPQHYGVVGVALMASLREYAGDRWTIEYDQAWRDAYDTIATRMLTAAERANRTPASWPGWFATMTLACARTPLGRSDSSKRRVALPRAPPCKLRSKTARSP